MKKRRKLLIIVICSLALLCAAVYGVLSIHENIVSQRELEAMMEAERTGQQRIIEAYVRLHYSFYMGGDPEIEGDATYRRYGRYLPLSDVLSSRNPFGIDVIKYQVLRMYYHRAGVILAYEAVVEFFSQEFEPDGSLRLYSNGRHPEIEAFVEWMWDGRRHPEVMTYLRDIENIYVDYVIANREKFTSQSIADLSPQMLDALARAEADPDYVLDLTSLQQQGY